MTEEIKKEKTSRTSMVNFAQLKELMLQNVSKTKSKTFMQYSKERIKTYLQNPYRNIDTIRDASAFLERTSMVYKKILAYYSLMPLFYYNLVYRSDWTSPIDATKMMKEYMETASKIQAIRMQKEFSAAIAIALRDGACYGYVYNDDDKGFFIHYLDPKYCKVSAITNTGQYAIEFNAAYFDVGDNVEYIKGVDEDGEAIWDDVFVDGYNSYKAEGRDSMWFELPPEKTFCLLAEENAEMALPYFLPVFTSLLDLIDLEQILASKTELENYVLLVSKVPMVPNSDEVDDFALSSEMIQYIQQQIDEQVPQLVGTAFSPCELEVVNFNKANSSEDTDKLAQSMHNLFSNLGVSELVVSSGSSTNSVGLKHSIQNDESFALKFVDRIESWMNSYIEDNYSENFIFKFHRVTYFSQSEKVNQFKEAASFGLPVATDYATCLGNTPYEMMCKTFMENALGIKNGLWTPLSTSYTMTSSDSQGGAPTKNDDELSPEGVKTRDSAKNETTKSGK